MVKKYLFFLAFVFCILNVNALTNTTPTSRDYIVLNASATGANSVSYYQNFLDLTNNFFDARFNVSQIFTLSTGEQILWTPWMDSSSSCDITNFQDTDYASANYTHNSMVTDEFSEIGIIIAQANNESRFLLWNTTFNKLNRTYGVLPVWRAARINNTLNITVVNDTASDASVRMAMAYYYAAMNTGFSVNTRNYSKQTADRIMSDHLRYEVVNTCYNSSYGNGRTCYWLAGGKENAITHKFSGDPFIYTGYFPDAITATLIAYNSTGNFTYLNMSEDYIEQYLTAANWTNTTGFRVATYNWKWDNSTTPLNITPGNTYYFNKSNPQWDDSDAPRTLSLCDNLRIYYKYVDPTFQRAYKNLTDYCRSYINSNTATNTTTTIQYYFNGTNATTIRSGFYENGLGAMMLTYWDYPAFKHKVDETLTHYSWSAKTYDSAACYGAYRGIRPVKDLAYGMGFDNFTNLNIQTPAGDTTAPVISNVASSSITTSSVIITWTTDELSNSTVNYSTTSGGAYSVIRDASLVTSHSVSITGLTNNTQYFYRVISHDTSGNFNFSSQSSFTTSQNSYNNASCSLGESIGYPIVMIFTSLSCVFLALTFLKGDMNFKDGNWSNLNVTTVIVSALSIFIIVPLVSTIANTIALRCII